MVAAAVLSGNRNFEGRVNADVRANYLASPPLVVAYALAGNMNVDVARAPLGIDGKGKKVYLRDLWPTSREIAAVIRKTINKNVFAKKYADVFKGEANWRKISVKGGLTYAWDDRSTYVQPALLPAWERAAFIDDIVDARILACSSTRSRPITFRRPVDQRGEPRRHICVTTGTPGRTSTSTAHGAAITR